MSVPNLKKLKSTSKSVNPTGRDSLATPGIEEGVTDGKIYEELMSPTVTPKGLKIRIPMIAVIEMCGNSGISPALLFATTERLELYSAFYSFVWGWLAAYLWYWWAGIGIATLAGWIIGFLLLNFVPLNRPMLSLVRPYHMAPYVFHATVLLVWFFVIHSWLAIISYVVARNVTIFLCLKLDQIFLRLLKLELYWFKINTWAEVAFLRAYWYLAWRKA